MKLTRRSLLTASAGGVGAALAGCVSGPGDSSDDGGDSTGISSAYTALFALSDWVENVTGGEVAVQRSVSVGQSGHGWEPPSDLPLDVAESDAFVYVDSPEFGWAQNVASQVEAEGVSLVDVLDGLGSGDLLDWNNEGGHHDHGADNHEEGSHDGGNEATEFHDPHVWVDPVLARDMVEYVAEQLGEIDPSNEEFYRENAQEYVDRLEGVHQQFRDLTEEASRDVAVFAGHVSYQYVESRYGFRIHSPQGISPNAQPSQDDIAETIELVEDENIDTILYDPFVTTDDSPPPLAQRILDSTDATDARPVSPLSGTTEEWLDDGWGWVEQMEEMNIPSFRAALGAD
jgi:zinc transport system substrate-binding protein